MPIIALYHHPEQDFMRVYRATLASIHAADTATNSCDRLALQAQARWRAEWALMLLDAWEKSIAQEAHSDDKAIHLVRENRIFERNQARFYLSSFLEDAQPKLSVPMGGDVFP